MKIVGGPSSVDLAHKISEVLNFPLAKVGTKRFPDGEFYFKFDEKIFGEDLLIVQSLYPSQDIHAMELFLMLQTARDLGAESIKVFVPYLAYSRQDERYLEGECLSSAMIAEIIEQLGADVLYTVDIHNEKVLKRYKIPVYNLTASGELAKYFVAKNLKDPIVIAPDAEELAARRARYAANMINADYDFLEKERNRKTGEIITFKKEIDVKGRDAIIIDDIISTGKTAANAANILKNQGARRVFVGVSHALLLGDSLKLLKDSGVDEIVGTDSVANEYAKVSVAPILARALK
ncbi:MAG: ribose-phosphate diphosphokinase [Candidatus Bathyarchaeia archaeon]